jgi:DNA-binding CsgD family transcriptional regulator/PAS domain-containing protein
VPALARGDAERLLRFLGEAESLEGDQPFTGELLVELGRLVPADKIGYNELDLVRRRLLIFVGRPGDAFGTVEDEVVWRAMLNEHPICLHHQDGYFAAMKLSDFLTQRVLHRTWLYDNFCRAGGYEHELDVAIPAPPWHKKAFILRRAHGDFHERDRLVLDLLQPHFGRLWRAARTRRLLAAALRGLDHATERDPRGVVILDVRGQVEFASPAARRLLPEFFPDGREAALPAAVAEWLESASKQPLVCRRGDRRVTVQRAGDSLLVEEATDVASLTAREREILTWVARGKTNPEIASILWVAPSTIRKHLENVYAKLGVSSRTAAVTRFLGLVDAEDHAAESGPT